MTEFFIGLGICMFIIGAVMMGLVITKQDDDDRIGPVLIYVTGAVIGNIGFVISILAIVKFAFF